MNKFNLIWICDSPSPYNSSLFKAIFLEENYSLKVIYRTYGLESHPWKSDLLTGYTNYCWFNKFSVKVSLIYLPLISKIKKDKNIFIVGSWNNVTVICLLILIILLKQPFIIWTDCPNKEKRRNIFFAFIRSMFLKYLFSKSLYTMGTGKLAVNSLIEIGSPRAKTFNFPYYIDTSLYKETKAFNFYNYTLKHPILKFISIGVLDISLKGHDVALLALEEFYKISKLEFNYTIVGEGPDRIKLQSLVNSLKIKPMVTFAGWVEQESLINIYLSNSHVLIHPSRAHEPYGVSVLEGLISGLPVLASNKTISGLDKITNNFNGYIHTAGNIKELTYNILSISANLEKLKTMSSNSITSMDKHTLKEAILKLNKIITGIYEKKELFD